MTEDIKTPEAVIKRYYPCIIRSAVDKPAKLINMETACELATTALPYHLARVANDPDSNPGYRQDLIRAIARERILLEKLAVIYCTDMTGEASYMFYLEQEAKAQDPLRAKNG